MSELKITTKELENIIREYIKQTYNIRFINEIRYNHPISNGTKTMFLIHNGVILNYMELYQTHKEKNHKYETYFEDVEKGKIIFNDSETILHELEECIKKTHKSMKKAFKKLLNRVEGSYSMAVAFKDKQRIYLFRKDNPLCIFKNENTGNTFFSSQMPLYGFEKIKELNNGELGTLSKTGYKILSSYKIIYDKYPLFYKEMEEEKISTINGIDDDEYDSQTILDREWYRFGG